LSCALWLKLVRPNLALEKNMKNLKRLSAAVVLTLVLALSAFAGETQTPPCAPLQPGQLETPPCASTQMTTDDSTTLRQINIPPTSNAVDLYSVVEGAMNVFQTMLILF
jgi:hypothetical protein